MTYETELEDADSRTFDLALQHSEKSRIFALSACERGGRESFSVVSQQISECSPTEKDSRPLPWHQTDPLPIRAY